MMIRVLCVSPLGMVYRNWCRLQVKPVISLIELVTRATRDSVDPLILVVMEVFCRKVH